MTDFRHVTDELSVAPQISLADVAEAKAQGFTAIICNRPDGEDPGQPSAAEVAAAAQAAGLTYTHIPVRGTPGPAEVAAMRQAVDAAGGPVLAGGGAGARAGAAGAGGRARAGARGRGGRGARGRAAGGGRAAARG